jgi:hypothetical protein
MIEKATKSRISSIASKELSSSIMSFHPSERHKALSKEIV